MTGIMSSLISGRSSLTSRSRKTPSLSHHCITLLDRRENLLTLTSFCDEFLVHGVDVEGKRGGIELDLVRLLGDFASDNSFPITYAGGIRSVEDLELVRREGKGAVDCTIGSALDCFGGDLSYQEVLHWHNQQNPR